MRIFVVILAFSVFFCCSSFKNQSESDPMQKWYGQYGFYSNLGTTAGGSIMNLIVALDIKIKGEHSICTYSEDGYQTLVRFNCEVKAYTADVIRIYFKDYAEDHHRWPNELYKPGDPVFELINSNNLFYGRYFNNKFRTNIIEFEKHEK